MTVKSGKFIPGGPWWFGLHRYGGGVGLGKAGATGAGVKFALASPHSPQGEQFDYEYALFGRI